jgi:hypothetical protein
MSAGAPRSKRSAFLAAVAPRLGRDVSRRQPRLARAGFVALLCGLVCLSGCTSGGTLGHTSAKTSAATVLAKPPVAPAVVALASPSAVGIPAPSAGGWRLNGSARLVAGTVVLTQAGRPMTAGSAIWPHRLTSSRALHAAFDVTTGGGTGADGLTFAVIDARTGKPTSLGHTGGGLGWAGVPGIAVAMDTFQNTGDPSFNAIGLVQGFHHLHPNRLTWAKADVGIPPLRNNTRRITVGLQHGVLTVTVDGAAALSASVTLPRAFLIGFTAANGARTDRHVVSHVAITTG